MREATYDNKGIERVPFATAHGPRATFDATRPKDAASIAPRLLNSDSEEATPETKVGAESLSHQTGEGSPRKQSLDGRKVLTPNWRQELVGKVATLRTIEPAGINVVAEDE